MAGPEDPRFDIMGDLHGYLEKTFPRVWATLDVETVQKWGLLLTWKGSDDKLKPVVLMAHQDVVPVNPSTSTSGPTRRLTRTSTRVAGSGAVSCTLLRPSPKSLC